LFNTTGGGVRHFGTLWTITDYANKSHVASAGITYQPTQVVTLNLRGNFVKAQAAFDPVIMPGVSQEILDQIEAADYDYSGIYEYSNFDYDQFDVTLGGSYQINPRLRFDAGMSYYDLKDNQGYVYGVESGSLWIVRAGFQVSM
jgi:long-subunit fatty acid transport protein